MSEPETDSGGGHPGSKGVTTKLKLLGTCFSNGAQANWGPRWMKKVPTHYHIVQVGHYTGYEGPGIIQGAHRFTGGQGHWYMGPGTTKEVPFTECGAPVSDSKPATKTETTTTTPTTTTSYCTYIWFGTTQNEHWHYIKNIYVISLWNQTRVYTFWSLHILSTSTWRGLFFVLFSCKWREY